MAHFRELPEDQGDNTCMFWEHSEGILLGLPYKSYEQ